jgi:FlaG/FlaF family flagellin (archaellin)
LSTRRRRIALAFVLSASVAATLAGCAGGASQPIPSAALLALPTIGTSAALENSFDGAFSSYRGAVSATFEVSNEFDGAVAVNRDGCALALVKPGSSRGSVIGGVFVSAAAGGQATVRIGGRTLADVVGPASAASFSDRPDHISAVTIYCGLRGVVVDIGKNSGKLTVEGSAIGVAAAGSVGRVVVIGPPAVLRKTH